MHATDGRDYDERGVNAHNWDGNLLRWDASSACFFLLMHFYHYIYTLLS